MVNRASVLDDQVSITIKSSVESLIAGRVAEAKKLLAGIDVNGLRRQRADLLTRTRNIRPDRDNETVEALSTSRLTGHSCLYCGKKTIELQVLKTLSACFQEAFPYELGWAFSHIVYWTHSTSLEHHLPKARQGLDAGENIQTTCYQCNDMKRDRLHSELEWAILNDGEWNPEWDGLSGLITPLRQAASKLESAAVLPLELRPVVAHLSLNPSRRLDTKRTRRRATSYHVYRGDIESSSRLDPADIRIGSLIRARIPQNPVQRRTYRVTAVEGGTTILHEMWREKGRWVLSKNPRRADLEVLAEIELLDPTAPEVGSPS